MDKQQQFDIVLKSNPKDPKINKDAYWIKSPDDILTYEEAIAEYVKENEGPCDYTPDWTWEDMQEAVTDNKIIIYSSYPIKLGTFVTPSKMEAESYGMSKNYPNKKVIPLNYVAWLDVGQGQYTGELTNSLTEATRNQVTTQSRNADIYKHNIRGKNRWERKKYSKVASQVKSYNQINMNDFFKKDLLTVTIPVTGETDNYEVQIQMEGVVAEIAKNIKSNGNKFEYRTVIQSLTKIFNSTNLKVKCSCDDYHFRYQHQLIINNDSVDGSDKDPGAGTTGMANTKGKGCKHILLSIANQDWLIKVASVIHNYIIYAETNMKAAFDKLIFPKLYGVPITAADEVGLVDEETDLSTDKHTIETINEFAKNKGKFKKGENKNPAKDSGKLDMEKIKVNKDAEKSQEDKK